MWRFSLSFKDILNAKTQRRRDAKLNPIIKVKSNYKLKNKKLIKSLFFPLRLRVFASLR